MAAIALAAPGTEYGPCAEPCDHTDCAESRRMAESLCTSCGKPIGYEQRVFILPGGFRGCHAAHES